MSNEENKMKTDNERQPVFAWSQSQKIILGLLFSAVMVVVAVMYGFKQLRPSIIKPQEEIYHVANDVPRFDTSLDNQNLLVDEKKPVVAVKPELDEAALKQQIELIQAQQKIVQQRLSAPLMLVNQQAASVSGSEVSEKNTKMDDANTQFMQQVTKQSVDVVHTETLGALNSVIAQGRLIHATLETAVNSDLPGYLRAIVNQAVYAEDGSRILIPAGSRLIGQYKSGLMQGQSRVFIVWTRLITPRGLSLSLGSPGVDALGQAGMGADHINRHFWQRFGQASLLSLLGASTSNIDMNQAAEGDLTTRYRDAVAASFSQSANQALQQDGRIAPTLSVQQGSPIIVFVARDLQFADGASSTQSALSIF